MAYRALDPVTIGKNVSVYRRMAGLTQAQLAEKINCTAAYISRVECGAKKLSLNMLVGMSEVFGVSCDAILFEPEGDQALININTMLQGKPSSIVHEAEQIIRTVLECRLNER